MVLFELSMAFFVEMLDHATDPVLLTFVRYLALLLLVCAYPTVMWMW
jgi:hypothetical protein